jgi:hypothetical protein
MARTRSSVRKDRFSDDGIDGDRPEREFAAGQTVTMNSALARVEKTKIENKIMSGPFSNLKFKVLRKTLSGKM